MPDQERQIRRLRCPRFRPHKQQENGKDRQKNDVHQRSGGDAPEHGAGTARRINEGDTAEGPQDDLIGGSAGLPAGERVPEFVEQHDAEQRHVFVGGPNLGTVDPGPLRQLVSGDEEPGKVQVNLDAAEFEKPNGAAHGSKIPRKRGERASFYKVTSAGVSDAINKRIGSMEDS